MASEKHGPDSGGAEDSRGASSVLATWLDRILELRQRGEQVDVEALAEGDAELARELAVMLSTLDVVEGQAHSARSPVAAGRVLGDFRIERELGRGGMGVVFLAHDTRLDRRVALKFLPVQAALDPSLRERFRREARAAGRLNHPGIVPVYGLGEQDGFLFLIMQYVEGQGLDRTARARPLDPRAAARLGTVLADALSYAHSHGIVHRDVKPANVIVNPAGEPRITDFGLCELRGDAQLTRTDAVMGTPRYMAPEQLIGQSSAQTDVYGLGATLYEALTGRPPYDDTRASYEQRLARPPTRPRRLVPELPRPLEAIVLKAMAALPEQRYTGALALKRDLVAFLENRPVDADPPGPADMLRLAYRRNRLASWVLGLALVVLAALTLVYVQGLLEARRSEERRAYVATVAAASAAFQASDHDLAARSLAASPEHLRSWEWRHLEARLDSELAPPLDLGSRVFGFELSPDGRWLAAGQGELVLVDREQPGRRFTFDHRTDVYGLAFSPDGRYVASCDHTGRALLVALGETPEVVAQADLPLPKARVPAFTPSSDRIAVGSYDGSVRTYDLDWSPVTERVILHGTRVYDLAFTRDGATLLSCGADGTLVALDLESGRARRLADHPGTLVSIDVHAERPWVVSSGGPGLVEVHDWRDGSLVESWYMPHASFSSDVHFAGDRHVIAVGNEASISIWELGRAEELARWTMPKGAVHGLAWNPRERTVLAAGRLGAVFEIDVFHPGGLLLSRPHVGRLYDVAFSRDGERLATVGRDTNVCVLDARTGRLQAVLGAHLDYGKAVEFGPEDRWLASGDETGRVVLWDAETWELLGDTGPAERADVRALAFTSDGTGPRLLVARDDRPLAELTLPDLEPIERAGQDLPSDVYTLIAGGELVALAHGRTVEVRRMRDLRLVWAAELESSVASLAFHPRLPRLVTGSRDGTVVSWGLGTGARVGSFELRTGGAAAARKILDLAFHPGGRHLAVVTERMNPLLVDPDTGEERLLLSGVLEFATAVAVSPDGRAIACTGTEGEVVLFDEVSTLERRSAAVAAGLGDGRLEAATSPQGLTQRVRELCVRDDLTESELYHAFLLAQEVFHHDVSDTAGYYLMNRIQARRGQTLAFGRLESLARTGSEPREEIFLTFLLSLLDQGRDQQALEELAKRAPPDREVLARAFSPDERARRERLLDSGR